jgi:hypothetical protein
MRMILTSGVEAPGEAEAAGAPRAPCDLRCECGSLLARVVGGRVELKCRRCKRVRWLQVEQEG